MSQSLPSYSKLEFFLFFNSIFGQNHFLFFGQTPSFIFLVLVFLCYPIYSQRPFLVLNLHHRHKHHQTEPFPPQHLSFRLLSANNVISISYISLSFSLRPILNRASLHAPLRGFESRVVSLIEVAGLGSRKRRGGLDAEFS